MGALGSTKVKPVYTNENNMIKPEKRWRVYTVRGHKHTRKSTYGEK